MLQFTQNIDINLYQKFKTKTCQICIFKLKDEKSLANIKSSVDPIQLKSLIENQLCKFKLIYFRGYIQ
jgi:hypothetical protein